MFEFSRSATNVLSCGYSACKRHTKFCAGETGQILTFACRLTQSQPQPQKMGPPTWTRFSLNCSRTRPLRWLMYTRFPRLPSPVSPSSPCTRSLDPRFSSSPFSSTVTQQLSRFLVQGQCETSHTIHVAHTSSHFPAIYDDSWHPITALPLSVALGLACSAVTRVVNV